MDAASMSSLVPGARVRVLPGRQFPAFGAGDVGVVLRVDEEARTCDVVFQGSSGGPVPVSLRHVAVEDPRGGDGPAEGASVLWAEPGACAGAAAPDGPGAGQRPPGRQAPPLAGVTQAALAPASAAACGLLPAGGGAAPTRPAAAGPDLAARVADLERRLLACEAVCGPGPALASQAVGRLVAQRVASLDGSQREAEAARDHEAALARQQSAAREQERLLEDWERRALWLQDAARKATEDMHGMQAALEEQERRSSGAEAAVAAAGAGLSQLGSLLEGLERRTSDLGRAINEANQGVGSLAAAVDAQSQRAADCDQAAERGRKEKDDPIWAALRELQELVVHETEHRAAGLREVLGVLGESIEQVRAEQAAERSAAAAAGAGAAASPPELEARCAGLEAAARTADSRLGALEWALASERAAREEAAAPAAAGRREGGAEVTTEMVTAVSLQRIEALEARFDRGGAAVAPAGAQEVHAAAQGGGASPLRRQSSSTPGALEKLRGHLEGLRSELAASRRRELAGVAATAAPGAPATLGAQEEPLGGAPRHAGHAPLAPPGAGSPPRHASAAPQAHAPMSITSTTTVMSPPISAASGGALECGGCAGGGGSSSPWEHARLLAALHTPAPGAAPSARAGPAHQGQQRWRPPDALLVQVEAPQPSDAALARSTTGGLGGFGFDGGCGAAARTTTPPQQARTAAPAHGGCHSMVSGPANFLHEMAGLAATRSVTPPPTSHMSPSSSLQAMGLAAGRADA